MASFDSRAAVLRIESESGIPIHIVRSFLGDLDHAYNYNLIAEILLSTPYREGLWERFERSREPRIGRWVHRDERLLLRSVEIKSPGFWEFLGSLNPLQQIRLFLNERHERLKDRNYRMAAESERLQLENRARAIQNEKDELALRERAALLPKKIDAGISSIDLDVEIKRSALLRDQVETARTLGIPEDQIRRLVEHLIVAPLERVQEYRMIGVVGEASVQPLSSPSDAAGEAEGKGE